MKIWAFPSFYPYSYPGMTSTGIFAHRQYKGLVEQGASLSVVVPVLWAPPSPFSSVHPEWKKIRKINYPDKRVYDGITVYHPRIANFKPNRFVKKSYVERYTDSIVDFFKDHRIALDPSVDIFYSQWLPDSVYVQAAAQKLGIRSAVLSIGDDVVVWPQSKEDHMRSFKKLLTEADLRFTCADFLGKEANKLMGKNMPYEVIHWGVDTSFFSPRPGEIKTRCRKKYNIPNEKVVILTIGAAIKRKGWLDLFDALVDLKKTNDTFLLVAVAPGVGELDLVEEAKKRGLASHFQNFGEMLPDRLNEMYNTADIFCLPSHWEGLANVVVEAMSSGLPVITTNVSGHPEIINNGVNGILVPPKNASVLAGELRILLSDEGIREKLGQNARNFIVNEWGDFAQNSSKLYKIMEQTITQNTKQAPAKKSGALAI